MEFSSHDLWNRLILLGKTKPIKTIEDIKGLKFRIMQNKIYADMFKALGANPVPLPWADLYSALEQGVVDGYE